MKINKLAIIANSQITGEKGGAEIFYEKLAEAFRKYIPIVDLINVPCSEATFEDILLGYLTCYDLKLDEYDGVISSKAPTYAVQHRNHVCYLMHPVRVFYDRYDEIALDETNVVKRDLIFRLDKELLTSPHCRKVYSIGYEVTNRQKKYVNIDSVPLHPGITRENFYCENYEYIFMPGRLHKWKRVDLVVEAMKFVKSNVQLMIAGTGSDMERLKKIAGDDTRIKFLGYVSDDEMQKLYANALAVTFTPLQEDYGYVLHEAFKSKKPVITVTDAGEPSKFVVNGHNGFLLSPVPQEIAEAIDYVYNNKTEAIKMGNQGYEDIKDITWDNVVKTLLNSLEEYDG